MTLKSEDSKKTPEVGKNISSNVEIPGIDTPPATPKAERKAPINPALRGIPKALLEKVSAN